VTTVSPWHVAVLSRYNADTQLIYNGFDPEIFYPAPMQSDVFYITYTGRVVSVAMNNPELLFKAVSKLVSEGIISPDLFKIRWFTNEKSRKIIYEESMKYPDIKEYMLYSDYVSAEEVARVLNESSILLILTNKVGQNGPKGIMATKFFEDLAVGKPVLSVRGDEDCLEDVINHTKSGLSAHNVDEVYDFIKHYYLMWKTKHIITNQPDMAEIQHFSRSEQAKQFIHILDNVINKYEKKD